MFAIARGQLNIAGVPPDYRHHKQGAAVISAILEKGSISEDDYIGLTGQEIGEELLRGNVFAFHHDSRQVTFQSTMMKRCCETKTSWWK